MLSRRRALGALSAPLVQTQKRQPNFLFILADDHAGYVLGCDGNRQAETPNLDRLAREGVRFAAHYCNQPVCTPSRQSFLTGQMPSMAGVTVLKTPLDTGKPTLAKQFKKAGYHTAVFGKMHFNQPSKPGLHGFDTMMTEQDINREWNKRTLVKAVPVELKAKPPWQPFKDPSRIWLNADQRPFGRYYEDMRGTFILRESQKFLVAKKDKPFALWVSFPEPHSPFDFPVEWTDKFSKDKFTPPRIGPEDAWQVPLIFRDLSEEDRRGIIASYYTSVNYLDKQIGELLETLRTQGLDDNTYVIYMADHGYMLGHHGRIEKHCCYDPALRVPLIMRYPGRIGKGKVIRDFTEHIDVPATITDMMGLEKLPIQHGQSLRPYLEGRAPAKRRDHIFSQYLENEEACVRTDRWKFVHCSGKRKRTDGYETGQPTPGRYVRLYDLKADPGEFTDVAAKHPDVVEQLRGLMLARYRSTHPEASAEPKGVSSEDALEFYLRPRDG